MKSEKVNIQHFLKYTVSLGVVLCMLLPIAVQTLDVLLESVHGYQVMTLDQHEKSQKEEKQEDNSKDEKIEMRPLSSYAHPVSSSEHSFSKTLETASDFILEIPIPPPEHL